MTVEELIELLTPYKHLITSIEGLEDTEILVEFGRLSFTKFHVYYQCNSCSESILDELAYSDEP